MLTYSEHSNPLRRRLFYGSCFYVLVYGGTALVIAILIADTVFSSLDACYKSPLMSTLFTTFTMLLTCTGLLLFCAYCLLHLVMICTFHKLPPAVKRAAQLNMNMFFLMMIVLLGTRSLYYLVYRFGLQSTETSINNDDLILIYVEEILFNFVVFYNLVLKELNDSRFEPQYSRTIYRRNNKRIQQEQSMLEESKNTLFKEEEEGGKKKVETETEEEQDEKEYGSPLYSPGSLREFARQKSKTGKRVEPASSESYHGEKILME